MPEREVKRSDTARIVITLAQCVLFVFLAFAGASIPGAPPASIVGGIPLAASVGMAAFGALLVFLCVQAWVGRDRGPNAARNLLFLAALFTVLFIVISTCYGAELNRRTFTFTTELGTPVSVVSGGVHTAHGDSVAAAYRRLRKRNPSPGELLSDGGAIDLSRLTSIWTADSIVQNHNRLVLLYTALLVILALALTSLLESYYYSTFASRERRAGSIP
jgi:hypothetical protein